MVTNNKKGRGEGLLNVTHRDKVGEEGLTSNFLA